MDYEEAKQLAINGEKIALEGDTSDGYWTIDVDDNGKIHYVASVINKKGFRESIKFLSSDLFNKKYNWIKYAAIHS